MKLKNSMLEIPEDNIFFNDKFSRKESVGNLTRLLKNVSSPLVLSVNAPWGAGKTTYMRMLHANLKELECKSIYFSAWETDFAIDPLLAFLGEMNIGLEGFLTGNPKKRKAWKKVKEVGVHILRRGVPVGVKLATMGIIDTDKIIEGEAGKLSEALSKDVVEQYTKDKGCIAEFKKNVAEVIAGQGEIKEKLYIFVDELDRCRPTYAIELLERIKHLLDVEGLIFILALDKVQLAHSVQAVYGADFDALGYLKRFIDIEFSLPTNDSNQFVRHLFTHLELDKYFSTRKRGDFIYDREHVIGAIKAVSYHMSLRSIEQLVSKIKLITLTVRDNEYFFPELIVFLLVIKDKYPDVYASLSSEEGGADDVLSLIEVVMPGNDDSSIWARQSVEALILAGKSYSAKAWYAKRVALLRDTAGPNNNVEQHPGNAARVIELVEHFTRGGRGISLSKVLNRIDMLSDFNFE
ncbi:KAP family NTPase [Pseudomonas sp. Pse35]|uniref:KAP family P-loop NTPase fold protein n=1 Tax=Pseudomonas sp. Pse35 TaxID=2926021 RepID=UPI0021C7CBB1|nr:KAP family NTPase [Pseudomonas sp. Pse35]